MIYAYIRISTDLQNVANQKHEILNYAKNKNLLIDKWVEEIISSRQKLHHRKLGNLIKKLKKGDVLIATEISRLGRNMLEIMEILKHCLEKECHITTIKENYNLGSDIQSKVLAFAFSLASEIERQLISQRTKESLKRLKEEGKHLGRPYGFNYQKLSQRQHEIKKLLIQNISKAEIARRMECTWATLYRFIQKEKLVINDRLDYICNQT